MEEMKKEESKVKRKYTKKPLTKEEKKQKKLELKIKKQEKKEKDKEKRKERMKEARFRKARLKTSKLIKEKERMKKKEENRVWMEAKREEKERLKREKEKKIPPADILMKIKNAESKLPELRIEMNIKKLLLKRGGNYPVRKGTMKKHKQVVEDSKKFCLLRNLGCTYKEIGMELGYAEVQIYQVIRRVYGKNISIGGRYEYFKRKYKKDKRSEFKESSWF